MKHIVTFLTLFTPFLLHPASWDLNEKLAFDDVLLEPRYSTVSPEIISTKTKLTRGIEIKIPIISAAIKTVTESCLAIALAEHGGIGIIHQDMPIDEQCYHVRMVKQFKTTIVKSSLAHHTRTSSSCNTPLRVGAAINADLTSKERVAELAKEKVDVIVVNAVHGHTQKVVDLVKWIKKHHPSIEIIAGNVATAQGALALADAGADAIKVGMGPGALSPVAFLTGVGMPQVSAIKQVADALEGRSIPIIADRGIRGPGDMCKALAAGADAVMIDLLFDQTQESPCDNELYPTNERSISSEEENSQLCCNNTVADITTQLITGLRTCMTYIGCTTITEMHERARFVRITNAAMLENY